MQRSSVRFVQVFISVFLALAVLTASLRNLAADGADRSAGALLQVAFGDALVLFVALGIVWVIPNRLWRADRADSSASPVAVSERSETANQPEDTAVPTNAPRHLASRDGGAGGMSPDMEKQLLLVLLPALVILVAGIVIYFVR